MRIEGICKCGKCDCGKLGWIDSMTSVCRDCEIEHASAWGKSDLKVEEGRQVQVDDSPPGAR